MAMQTEFAIPKRNDEINEHTLLTGIGHEREIRFDETMDVGAWIKQGYNYLEIAKNAILPASEDHSTYACAMYVCKKVKPFEVV